MSKIYEGEIKLNVLQVAGVLNNEMPETHKAFIGRALKDGGLVQIDPRKAFAHAVLDMYKYLPTQTAEEEKSKKYCKHLMEKFMKSTVEMEGERSIYRVLCNTITNENSAEDIA
jgi:hypothetical protein